jgi:hypothetical protein
MRTDGSRSAGLTVGLFALAAGLLRVGEAHAQRQGSFQMF